MTTFILCAIGFLGLTWLLHEGHRRDKAKAIEQVEALMLSLHDTEVGGRDDEIAHLREIAAQHESAATDWRKSAAIRADSYYALRDKYHDLRNLYTAEQGRVEILEGELRRVAEQVAGKCLWPTLAEDDVVIEFPKRGRA